MLARWVAIPRNTEKRSKGLASTGRRDLSGLLQQPVEEGQLDKSNGYLAVVLSLFLQPEKISCCTLRNKTHLPAAPGPRLLKRVDSSDGPERCLGRRLRRGPLLGVGYLTCLRTVLARERSGEPRSLSKARNVSVLPILSARGQRQGGNWSDENR